jgi:hypothetical protein
MDCTAELPESRSEQRTRRAVKVIRRGQCDAIVAVAAVLLWPSLAVAQTDASVVFGGGIAFHHPVDDMAHDSTGFALAYRFGKPDGWRPTFGFNWFRMEFDGFVAGERIILGELRVRPIMGGYGYTWRFGPLAATASLIGGYAFNGFDTDDQARLAYQRTLQTTLLRVSASNSLAARAEVTVWYDVSSRIGLLGAVGFVAAHPEITIVTDVGREERRLRADSLKLQIGIAYGIF